MDIWCCTELTEEEMKRREDASPLVSASKSVTPGSSTIIESGTWKKEASDREPRGSSRDASGESVTSCANAGKYSSDSQSRSGSKDTRPSGMWSPHRYRDHIRPVLRLGRSSPPRAPPDRFVALEPVTSLQVTGGPADQQTLLEAGLSSDGSSAVVGGVLCPAAFRVMPGELTPQGKTATCAQALSCLGDSSTQRCTSDAEPLRAVVAPTTPRRHTSRHASPCIVSARSCPPEGHARRSSRGQSPVVQAPPGGHDRGAGKAAQDASTSPSRTPRTTPIFPGASLGHGFEGSPHNVARRRRTRQDQ